MAEMDHTLKLTRKIHIQTEPATVWHALTDGETIKRYFFGTEAISDWKVGSSLTFQGEWEGQQYVDKGHILAVKENELLRYDYWSGFSGLEDIRENYSIVTYNLTQKGEGTVVSVTQQGFAGKEALSHAEGGWAMVLENLKKLLEQG
jgi:uncharacterized protein YndB with AHSA1/START domain